MIHAQFFLFLRRDKGNKRSNIYHDVNFEKPSTRTKPFENGKILYVLYGTVLETTYSGNTKQ